MTIQLPLYEPHFACEGYSNRDVEYTVTPTERKNLGWPSWAEFDEQARQITIKIQGNEHAYSLRGGRSPTFEVTAEFRGIKKTTTFTVYFSGLPEAQIVTEE